VEAIDYSMKIKLKSKLKTVLEFGGHSWCCWKAPGKSDLIELISQFSELRCGKC